MQGSLVARLHRGDGFILLPRINENNTPYVVSHEHRFECVIRGFLALSSRHNLQ